MSAQVVIDACPCEFKDGCVSIMLSLMVNSDLYRKSFEASKVSEIDAELEVARTALAGKDAAIMVRIKGRKPNGYEAWYRGLGQRKYVKAVQS